MFKKINRENKKGFTLAELLIVVAIIGVLVAISIPIFTTQLEKARESTDIANLRAAKAAAVTAVLEANPKSGSVEESLLNGTKVYYDPSSGKLVAGATGIMNGKGTDSTVSGITYASDQPYKEFSYDGKATTSKVISVQYSKDTDSVTIKFE